MYWLDKTILVVLASGILVGALLGFLRQMFWILGFSAGLCSAILFNGPATALLKENLMQESTLLVAQLAAFPLVFFLAYFLLLVLGSILTRLVKLFRLQLVNRLLGAALAGGIVASVGSLIFLGLEWVPEARPMLNQSEFAPLLANAGKSVLENLPDEYHALVQENVDHLKSKAQELKEQLPTLAKNLNEQLKHQLQDLQQQGPAQPQVSQAQETAGNQSASAVVNPNRFDR